MIITHRLWTLGLLLFKKKNNNNNDEKICIAQTLKTSDALMAHWQTNSVLVYVRMYAVTERGVVGLQADWHDLWTEKVWNQNKVQFSLRMPPFCTQNFLHFPTKLSSDFRHWNRNSQPYIWIKIHFGTCWRVNMCCSIKIIFVYLTRNRPRFYRTCVSCPMMLHAIIDRWKYLKVGGGVKLDRGTEALPPGTGSRVVTPWKCRKFCVQNGGILRENCTLFWFQTFSVQRSCQFFFKSGFYS